MKLNKALKKLIISRQQSNNECVVIYCISDCKYCVDNICTLDEVYYRQHCLSSPNMCCANYEQKDGELPSLEDVITDEEVNGNNQG